MKETTRRIEWHPAENLWLQSLRKDIKYKKEIEFLLKVYDTKKYSKLHQAAMDVITRANWESMMEAKDNMMCDALQELFADEFKQMEEKATEKVTEEVTEKVTTQMIKNTYESIKDPNTIAQILKLPLETIKKSLQI